MRFMVHFQVTPEAGREIEKRPGGPGPIVGRVVERFKPEAMYMSPARRECWMIVDLASNNDVGEAMIALTEIAGQYPEFLPVATLQEFGPMVQKVIPAARKLIDG